MKRPLVLIPCAVAVLLGLIVASQLRAPEERLSGFLEADEIRVGSRLGGRVQEVKVAEGEAVAAGQPLVVLEPFDLLQQENEARQTLAAREAAYQRTSAGYRPEEIAQAQARFAQAQARLDLLEAGPRPQEIAAARSRTRAATAELALARQTYARNAELFERQAISREEVDRAVERLEAAEALSAVRQEEQELLELGSREEEIREARAIVEQNRQAWLLAEKGYRPEEVAEARAARDAAQAALDVIGARKNELVIASPTAGTIEAVELQPGDLAPAGGPVLSLMDRRRLWVRVYVPQNRVGLQVGQALTVTADSTGPREFRGRISYIARQAEFTPSNVQTPEERDKQVFRMKVELEEGLDVLRPGMSADVWLTPPDAAP